MHPIYETVEYCDVPDCHCLDRQGVILYRGKSKADAETAAATARPGYAVQVTTRMMAE